jgi:hypothetical protein
MLRNGHVWHYSAYDHRPEFAQVTNLNSIISCRPQDPACCTLRRIWSDCASEALAVLTQTLNHRIGHVDGRDAAFSVKDEVRLFGRRSVSFRFDKMQYVPFSQAPCIQSPGAATFLDIPKATECAEEDCHCIRQDRQRDC